MKAMSKVQIGVVALVVVLGVAVLPAGSPAAYGQETTWEVPEDARARENPIPASDEVVESGAEIYDIRCLMCHGESGKGDGPATTMIKPAPPDVSTAEARERLTDGEMFYKISEGRRPMPAQKGKISDEDIWALVHYVRSLQATN